jgi:hypothetical protein
MTVSRAFLNVATAVLLSTGLTAQDQLPTFIAKLLPPDAKVIEAEKLYAGKPRELVLWMLHPDKVVRSKDSSYCGDLVYGDYWSGAARLSLVDLTNKTLIV